MSIGDIIRASRKRKGMNQGDLAKAMPVTQAAVSAWETGLREPNKTQRKRLCEVLGITEAELYGGTDDKEPLVDHGAPLRKIPVLSWVYANRFQSVPDQSPTDEYVYTDKTCNCFALRVYDDCMSPVFQDSDVIIIDPDAHIDHGSYVVVIDRASDAATFKQFRRAGDNVILHPLNPAYEDIVLDHDNRYRIVGKVIQRVTGF